MNAPADRSGTALLVVDVQVGVMDPSIRRDEVVANVSTLVDQARAAATPVVWVMHGDDELERDSDAWQLVPELSVADGEAIVHKSYGDSFEATDLDAVLGDLDVGSLIVAGAQTDACITSTLHGAAARGYGVMLVSDAHTTEDLTEWGGSDPASVISHTNLMWGMHAVEGRATGTVTTADAEFG
ncbi:MAG: isochorismatase family protein [Actinomycetota bacterium]